MQWVHREKRRDNRTPPCCAGHLLQHTKQQKHGDGVQDHVRRVVPASV